MKKALDEKVRQRSPFTLYIVSSLSLTMHMDMALVITESGEAAQQPAPADQPAGEQAHDLRGEAGGCGGLRPRGALRHCARDGGSRLQPCACGAAGGGGGAGGDDDEGAQEGAAAARAVVQGAAGADGEDQEARHGHRAHEAREERHGEWTQLDDVV